MKPPKHVVVAFLLAHVGHLNMHESTRYVMWDDLGVLRDKRG